MATDTRQRMIETAARLFQEDGYNATSWRRLVDAAGTPWGSIAHHFPGGKEELGVAAIQAGADAVSALIRHCFETTPTPEAAIGLWFERSAKLMTASDYRQGCPIATVALETTGVSPSLTSASRQGFTAWEGEIALHLREHGFPRAVSQRVAGDVLTLLEGALLRSRVQGTAAPLQRAGVLAAALVTDAARG